MAIITLTINAHGYTETLDDFLIPTVKHGLDGFLVIGHFSGR